MTDHDPRFPYRIHATQRGAEKWLAENNPYPEWGVQYCLFRLDFWLDRLDGIWSFRRNLGLQVMVGCFTLAAILGTVGIILKGVGL